MHRECLSNDHIVHLIVHGLQAGRQPSNGIRVDAAHVFRPSVRREVIRGAEILLCHRIQDDGCGHEYLLARSLRLSIICLRVVLEYEYHRIVCLAGLD